MATTSPDEFSRDASETLGHDGDAMGATRSSQITVRNPIVIVLGFAEVATAAHWMRQEAHGSPRLTFAYVIDTGSLISGLGMAGVSPTGFIADARRDGEEILGMLRRAAPENASVTTRLLESPASYARQILRAAAETPCCDAIVICTTGRCRFFSSDARTIRRVRSGSSVKVIVAHSGDWGCSVDTYKRGS